MLALFVPLAFPAFHLPDDQIGGFYEKNHDSALMLLIAQPVCPLCRGGRQYNWKSDRN